MSIFNDEPLKATCYRNGAHLKLTRPLFASYVINNKPFLLVPMCLKKKTKENTALLLESVSITCD